MKLFTKDLLNESISVGGTVWTEYLVDIDADGQVIALTLGNGKCWAYQEGDDRWIDVDNPAQSVEVKKIPGIVDVIRQAWNQ